MARRPKLIIRGKQSVFDHPNRIVEPVSPISMMLAGIGLLLGGLAVLGAIFG